MNALYFALASFLFMLSCYQVELSTQVLEKQDRMMPAHLQRAFEAGCMEGRPAKHLITAYKVFCKQEALEFRAEQDRIYN